MGGDDRDQRSTANLSTPLARGAATFTDIDGDGTLDVLLPTADEIATSPFGVASRYPFPSTVDPSCGPRWSST